jgi:hypothetical protein
LKAWRKGKIGNLSHKKGLSPFSTVTALLLEMTKALPIITGAPKSSNRLKDRIKKLGHCQNPDKGTDRDSHQHSRLRVKESGIITAVKPLKTKYQTKDSSNCRKYTFKSCIDTNIIF